MSGVFISYRRSDSAPWAGRLRDRLVAELPDRHVFFDIDNISLGVDFRKVIADTLADCDVVLLLIGPDWLERDGDGVRRIDDAADLHRVEVESSLRSGTRLIPILVGGASMPRTEELPDTMRELAFRNAHKIEHASFGRDVDVLVRALRQPAAVPPAVTPVVPPVQAVALETRSSELNSQRREGGRRRVVFGTIAAAAAIVAVGLVVLGGRDDQEQGSNSEPSASPAETTIAPLVIATAAPITTLAATEGVVLPDPTSVFDQPVDDAVDVLEAARLAVEVRSSGCSNSVAPGRVRRVTVGSDLDTGIIYGKPGDAFDLGAAASLAPGDLVTVWTPSENPC